MPKPFVWTKTAEAILAKLQRLPVSSEWVSALDYWADPGRQRTGEINRNDGGRGVYFEDPDDHLLEIITRPYGTGGSIAAQG